MPSEQSHNWKGPRASRQERACSVCRAPDVKWPPVSPCVPPRPIYVSTGTARWICFSVSKVSIMSPGELSTSPLRERRVGFKWQVLPNPFWRQERTNEAHPSQRVGALNVHSDQVPSPEAAGTLLPSLTAHPCPSPRIPRPAAVSSKPCCLAHNL